MCIEVQDMFLFFYFFFLGGGILFLFLFVCLFAFFILAQIMGRTPLKYQSDAAFIRCLTLLEPVLSFFASI